MSKQSSTKVRAVLRITAAIAVVEQVGANPALIIAPGSPT